MEEEDEASIPYADLDEPWVAFQIQLSKAVQATVDDVFVFGLDCFADVGLPSFDSFSDFMNPTIQKGRTQCYIMSGAGELWLVKEIANLDHGRNKLMVGIALREAGSTSCLGAVFGWEGKSSVCAEASYFIAIPWLKGRPTLWSISVSRTNTRTTWQLLQLIY